MDKSIADAIKEIDDAKWEKDRYDCLNLVVKDSINRDVIVQLELTGRACDRGHITMKIDGNLDIDDSDMFPRYFFSFEEADNHARTFLKWRLYKFRVNPHELEVPEE